MFTINEDISKNLLEKEFKRFANKKIFSGISLGIATFFEDISDKFIFSYGKTDNSENPVTNDTLFDLASLTKPFVTILSLLVLIEEGKIFWKEKLPSLLSLDVPDDKKDICLTDLMSHKSGLPAHKPYYKLLSNTSFHKRKTKILEYILQEKLIYPPGEKNIYSDLGYILLGEIVEKKSGKSLDEYWQIKICNPLFLQNELLFPKNNRINKRRFACTKCCSLTHKKLCGIVNDDNCRFMGGIAGHAGLFGTAKGVLSICEKILLGYYDKSNSFLFSNEKLKDVLKKDENSLWTLGFDTPSPTFSSSGIYFSNNTVGHLGFTGTSFWIDLQKKIIVVLLTNRTYFCADNKKIKKFRPFIHNLIMQKIISQQP
jgi:serine-type D-Ala-D-Ala carboxypeptidase